MDDKEATRTCGQCHKEVAESNFALHETHCSRFLCMCPDCGETVPRDQLEEHREEQHTLVRCTKCHQKMERCLLSDHELDECVERQQCCKFCELALPWRELAEHSLACGSRTERCADCGRYVTLKDQAEHQHTCTGDPDGDQAAGWATRTTRAAERKEFMVGCSYCGSPFPSGAIEEHEMECIHASSRWDTKYGEAEWRWRKEEEEEEKEEAVANHQLRQALKSNHALKQASGVGQGGGGNGGDEDSHEIGSCPHCHLALPLVTLRWHEAKCRLHLHLRH